MDYTYIIKRNLITLMEKYKHIDMEESNHYKNALLQLPNHPILDVIDVENVYTTEKISHQIKQMIDTLKDLEEVTEYLDRL